MGLAPAQAQEATAVYARARAADAAGAAGAAAAGYARVLAAEPTDEIVAMRAYRQAVAIGDFPLASRSAAVLVRGDVAPPDTAVVDFAVALHGHDAKGAAAAVARMKDGPLDFMMPVLGAWLAFDRGEDGVAILDGADATGFARRYIARHRALLLIASKRSDEGMMALLPQLADSAAVDARIDAAQLFAANGDRRRARVLLDGDQPELAALRRHIEKVRPGAAFGAARLFLALASDIGDNGMDALSVALARAALLLDPEDDRARLYLAEALSRAGSDDLALTVLRKIGPDSPFARGAAVGEVAALRRAGRSAEALGLARGLATAPGTTSEDARNYGDMLAEDGQFDAAAAAYQRALSAEAGDWNLHYLRGTALDRAGRWPEAQTALERAVALGPQQADALSYLGNAQIERGENMVAAQALLERASKLKPGDADISASLAWAYYQRGEVSRALPLLEKAARGDPASPRVNEHLGDAYWRLGRHYEARYAWNAAAVYADNDAARRIEAKLADGLKSQAN